ncbi:MULTISPECIES: hypothetical protein [Candidatus Nitrosocaldus]|jgi:hypothetical protein|uniref:Uncharacterized protein n=1 Tax=Candidatus Nitrosocaldus cavascurensis TaxID=2058097 RepID=A0A2K5APC6_9ARCH|nr:MULTISPECIES: hypothetical protein [Candidatus Nitrosocaldus]SPC33496.1 protein of unknown function [Candidatus Nitrosocaldus cavascurensis]
MDMLLVASIQLYHFLEALVDSINHAVESAVRDSTEEPLTFIPSSIEVGIRCSLEYNADDGVYIMPSNALVANYYGKGKDAIIQARISPIPRSSSTPASSGAGAGAGSSIDVQDMEGGGE